MFISNIYNQCNFFFQSKNSIPKFPYPIFFQRGLFIRWKKSILKKLRNFYWKKNKSRLLSRVFLRDFSSEQFFKDFENSLNDKITKLQDALKFYYEENRNLKCRNTNFKSRKKNKWKRKSQRKTTKIWNVILSELAKMEIIKKGQNTSNWRFIKRKTDNEIPKDKQPKNEGYFKLEWMKMETCVKNQNY